MSYRAGMQGFARIGGVDSEPRLICDGCGAERTVQKPSGMPYAWFLDRKRAPGWSADLSGDMRKDWCAECTSQEQAAKS